jgi:hypothetical protein
MILLALIFDLMYLFVLTAYKSLKRIHKKLNKLQIEEADGLRNYCELIRSRDSLVGISTSYGLDEQGGWEFESL